MTIVEAPQSLRPARPSTRVTTSVNGGWIHLSSGVPPVFGDQPPGTALGLGKTPGHRPEYAGEHAAEYAEYALEYAAAVGMPPARTCVAAPGRGSCGAADDLVEHDRALTVDSHGRPIGLATIGDALKEVLA